VNVPNYTVELDNHSPYTPHAQHGVRSLAVVEHGDAGAPRRVFPLFREGRMSPAHAWDTTINGLRVFGLPHQGHLLVPAVTLRRRRRYHVLNGRYELIWHGANKPTVLTLRPRDEGRLIVGEPTTLAQALVAHLVQLPADNPVVAVACFLPSEVTERSTTWRPREDIAVGHDYITGGWLHCADTVVLNAADVARLAADLLALEHHLGHVAGVFGDALAAERRGEGYIRSMLTWRAPTEEETEDGDQFRHFPVVLRCLDASPLVVGRITVSPSGTTAVFYPPPHEGGGVEVVANGVGMSECLEAIERRVITAYVAGYDRH
jgi:hypothetical protein